MDVEKRKPLPARKPLLPMSEYELDKKLEGIETNESCIESIIKEYSLNANLREYVFMRKIDSYVLKLNIPFTGSAKFDYIEKKIAYAPGKQVSLKPLNGGNNKLQVLLTKINELKHTCFVKTEYEQRVGYILARNGEIISSVHNSYYLMDPNYNGYPRKGDLNLMWKDSLNENSKILVIKVTNLEELIKYFPKSEKIGTDINSIEEMLKTESSKKDENALGYDEKLKIESVEDLRLTEKLKIEIAEELRLERCSKMLAAVVILPDDKERLRTLITTDITPSAFSDVLKNAVDRRREKEIKNELRPDEKESILEDEILIEIEDLEEL